MARRGMVPLAEFIVGGRFYAALGLSFWWMSVLDAGAGWWGARAARPFVDLDSALIAIARLR